MAQTPPKIESDADYGPEEILQCDSCGSTDLRLDTSGEVDCVSCGATVNLAETSAAGSF